MPFFGNWLFLNLSDTLKLLEISSLHTHSLNKIQNNFHSLLFSRSTYFDPSINFQVASRRCAKDLGLLFKTKLCISDKSSTCLCLATATNSHTILILFSTKNMDTSLFEKHFGFWAVLEVEWCCLLAFSEKVLHAFWRSVLQSPGYPSLKDVKSFRLGWPGLFSTDSNDSSLHTHLYAVK